MKTCNDVMTKAPICCLAHDSVARAAQIMHFENVGAVPVIDSFENQHLIGIITDRDIALRVVGEKRDANETTVGDVMSADVCTCHPDDLLRDALDKMAEYQVRRLPVVTESGQIAGIIAQADIAIRVDDSDQTAEVVEQISQPKSNLVLK